MSRIEEYGLLANCKTAALVNSQGAIEWLCTPRFDSGACFAALLGEDKNGRWLLVPEGKILKVDRNYRSDTFTLETHYITESGHVTVIDCMCMSEDSTVTLIRQVHCSMGSVPVRMEFSPRFDYGFRLPLVDCQGDCTLFICGPNQLAFYSNQTVQKEQHSVSSSFELKAGEKYSSQMSWTYSHEKTAQQKDPAIEISQTENFWRQWIRGYQLDDQSEHPPIIRRSLLVIKALTYMPTGSIVAAPTTSLPEILGGNRNWDYRYCWPRDAALAMHAIINSAEQSKEADAWRHWLLKATAGVPSQMEVLYGLLGERPSSERELPWLKGHQQSSPVRIGNEAHDQRQLDIYGYVIEVFYAAEKLGLPHMPQSWTLTCKILNYLEDNWQQPDEGIWEVRGPQRHFVHSRVMVWSAFNWGIKAHEEFGLKGPVEKWKEIKDRVFKEVCEKGFDKERNSFVQFYGSKDTDASLLMIPIVGFLPADDPRMIGTVKAIEEDLLIEEGLIMRYQEDEEIEGLPPGGNKRAFLLCCSWLGINYVMQGQKQKAQRVLEKLYAIANDLGLLAEQYDPREKRQLGNFPQAFSHIALITLELAIREGRPRQY